MWLHPYNTKWRENETNYKPTVTAAFTSTAVDTGTQVFLGQIWDRSLPERGQRLRISEHTSKPHLTHTHRLNEQKHSRLPTLSQSVLKNLITSNSSSWRIIISDRAFQRSCSNPRHSIHFEFQLLVNYPCRQEPCVGVTKVHCGFLYSDLPSSTLVWNDLWWKSRLYMVNPDFRCLVITVVAAVGRYHRG